ncbi:hypothetical protein D9758_015070 [Tetrapyrgos nigripes]|uniref:Protein kinase domain-containing protein n=1 Tax=Tetrapyrgos nigripes TaxID=182062 RepID=A0A8H5C8L2_9AGAR|nr:hypothetical protein D9758_015070 [Tetrapyrgos nigripes]
MSSDIAPADQISSDILERVEDVLRKSPESIDNFTVEVDELITEILNEYGDESDSCQDTAYTLAYILKLTNEFNFMFIKPKIIRDIFLGGGSFGSVFKANYNNSAVALKIIDQAFTDKKYEQLKTWFSRELRHWRDISNHDNVLELIGCYAEVNEGSIEFGLVSPFANGGSLSEFCENRKVTLAAKHHHLVSIALGLQHLHNQREALIHGDLCCDNVLVHDEVVKIADFGLSKYDAGISTLTMQGYTEDMNFERIGPGVSSRTKETDIFAFGSLAYEVKCTLSAHCFILIDFEQLFTGSTAQFQLAPYTWPSRPYVLGDARWDDLWRIVEDCWAKEPVNRPSAEDLVSRLQRAAGSIV